MDFQEVVRRRRMVRSFAPVPVDAGLIQGLVANAVRAPNAGFSQGWGFLVLDTPADVERFWAVTTPERTGPASAWLRGMRTAPVVIVPHSSRDAYLARYAEPDKGWDPADGDPWDVPYWHVDAGMASLLILQSAVAVGLGACFFGIPRGRTEAFRHEFGVPAEYLPVGAIAVGHPASGPAQGSGRTRGSPERRRRKDLDEVVHRGRW